MDNAHVFCVNTTWRDFNLIYVRWNMGQVLCCQMKLSSVWTVLPLHFKSLCLWNSEPAHRSACRLHRQLSIMHSHSQDWNCLSLLNEIFHVWPPCSSQLSVEKFPDTHNNIFFCKHNHVVPVCTLKGRLSTELFIKPVKALLVSDLYLGLCRSVWAAWTQFYFYLKEQKSLLSLSEIQHHSVTKNKKVKSLCF